MTRADLRSLILKLVPTDSFVEASWVVEMTRLPVSFVWTEIVMMAFDGVIECDRGSGASPINLEGRAMIRRGAGA